MSVLFFPHDPHPHSWKIGEPLPENTRNSVTSFIADGAELAVILAALQSQTAPDPATTPWPATGEPPATEVRSIAEIANERRILTRLSDQHFQQHELARIMAAVLDWVLKRKGYRPTELFGWITTSIAELTDSLIGNGRTATADNLLLEIAEKHGKAKR